MGPKVRRLIAHKMAQEAIPSGGGMNDGLKFLLSPDLGQKGRAAADWVREAIAVVKTAPDNPYGDDDEAIAGELLRRLETRK